MTSCNGIGCEMLTGGESFPIVSSDPTIQNSYVAMRRDGQSHSMAEMLAFRQGPGLRTDNTFFANQDSQYADPKIRAYRQLAEQSGVDVNGAKYFSQLARWPGDPLAWKRSRGEIVEHCETFGMGLTMDGEQKVKARLDAPPAPDIPIAPDIVHDKLEDVFDSNPELERECLAKPAKLEEVKEQVRESLLPDYTPEPIPAL